jgi:hypothetical protein
MPVSVYFVMCSMLSLGGMLLGCAFLIYAMLKSNIKLIRNAFIINLATVTCVLVLSLISKEVFYLPQKFQSEFATSIDIILLGLFVFLGLLALTGISYYYRALYLPEAIIKSSFAISAIIIFTLFTIAFKAAPRKNYTVSAKHKFMPVDQKYTLERIEPLNNY